MSPTRKSPEQANTLQKYLLLHLQRHALEQVLNNTTSSPPSAPPRLPSSPILSRGSSLPSSSGSEENYPFPIFAAQQLPESKIMSNAQHIRPEVWAKRPTTQAGINDNILEEVEEKKIELNYLNEEIKSTLMNLLNCEGVKNDKKYRTWVQTRLMDTEKELSEFRRQSCKRRSMAAAATMFQ